MIPAHFTTSPSDRGMSSPSHMPHPHSRMIRVVVMPHVQSMSYLDEETLDPACFWHGTIEELRKEPRAQEKVGFSSIFQAYYSRHLVGLGQS